jgi:hypothetical protein
VALAADGVTVADDPPKIAKRAELPPLTPESLHAFMEEADRRIAVAIDGLDFARAAVVLMRFATLLDQVPARPSDEANPALLAMARDVARSVYEAATRVALRHWLLSGLLGDSN